MGIMASSPLWVMQEIISSTVVLQLRVLFWIPKMVRHPSTKDPKSGPYFRELPIL